MGLATAGTRLGGVPDRILLTLDMTETFRPCELFALRWSGFDMDRRTLTVSQTAFLGQAAQLRRDHEVVAHGASPTRLANELWLWKQECPDASPHAFIFPNSRKRNGATKNGFIRTNNHCVRVPKNLAEEVQLKKLNFQVLRRTIATLAQTNGSVRDVQGILAHTKADTTANVYMQQIDEGVKQTRDAIYAELTAAPKAAAVS